VKRLERKKDQLEAERLEIGIFEVFPAVENGLGDVPNIVSATVSLKSVDEKGKRKFHKPRIEYNYDVKPPKSQPKS
jgi:hypothetical protein